MHIIFKMWLMSPLECFFSIEDACSTIYRNPGPGYNTILIQLILGDFYSPCPQVDSSTHYPAFYTVRLHCQTPTLMPHVCQAGGQFVPFLWWSLVWFSWSTNQRPTAWGAGWLATKPSWRAFKMWCTTHCRKYKKGNTNLSIMNTPVVFKDIKSLCCLD